MAARISPPILIGITGKRDLAGKEAAVTDALKACFDLLDRALPASGKTLLTGLATGADTVAAQRALERGWKVVAVLPFALELYLQDFEPADAAKLLELADPEKGLLRNPAKGRVIVLDPLCDPVARQPFEPAALARAHGESNPVRSDHYEQVGLFIAERCALLIGVMPASEKPDRVGGTARILEYQLRGAFDATCERIIEQSRILLAPMHLDSPHFRPVWLIDLETVGDDEPLRSVQVWHPAPLHTHAEEIQIRKTAWSRREDLTRPLRLAGRVEDFNVLLARFDAQHPQQDLAQAAQGDRELRGDLEDRAHADTGDAASMLTQIRAQLSVIQTWAKRRTTATVVLLAGFFMLAVVALEIVHADVRPLGPSFAAIPFDWSMLYVVASIAILLVLFYARRKKLSQYTEDYRAVSEALRVQLAWWNAGLLTSEYRVNRFYLHGTTGTLALVRTAVDYLIGAALLERRAPMPSGEGVQKWINDQIKYFDARTKERERFLSRRLAPPDPEAARQAVAAGAEQLASRARKKWTFLSSIEDLIWFLFIGSIGTGVALVALGDRSALIARFDLFVVGAPKAVGWAFPWVALILVWLLLWLFRALAHMPRPRGSTWWRFLTELPGFFAALFVGILCAAFIYGIMRPPYGGAEFLSRTLLNENVCPDVAPGPLQLTPGFLCAQVVSYRLLAVLTAIAAAFAGAVRFYTERMALEPELHSYREALATFQRARRELARLKGDESEQARKRTAAILFELGRIALGENAAWIRAHRVRPLEPHV